MNMTIVSIYICYCVYYQVDCLFVYNLLYVYILFDFLFIPIHRKDTILHHILVLLMFQYNSTYNIPVDNFSFPIIQLFKTEVSSVFLGTSIFWKNTKQTYWYAMHQICCLFLLFFITWFITFSSMSYTILIFINQ